LKRSSAAVGFRRSRRSIGLFGATLALSAAWASAAEAYGLKVSDTSDRANAVTLAGQTYANTASIYVFTSPADSYARDVAFYLNDPSRSRAPRSVEDVAQYDFNGTNTNGTAIGYSLSGLTSGATYTITAVVRTKGGNQQVMSGTFEIASGTDGQTLRFADEFNGSSLDTTKWSA